MNKSLVNGNRMFQRSADDTPVFESRKPTSSFILLLRFRLLFIPDRRSKYPTQTAKSTFETKSHLCPKLKCLPGNTSITPNIFHEFLARSHVRRGIVEKKRKSKSFCSEIDGYPHRTFCWPSKVVREFNFAFANFSQRVGFPALRDYF